MYQNHIDIQPLRKATISLDQVNKQNYQSKMADIEGSKPRKFITKTKLTNPSLYSISLTSLLDPENQSLSKIYEALQKKQKITAERDSRLYQLSPQKADPAREIKREMSNRQQMKYGDSLQRAEKEFEQRRKEQVGSRRGGLESEPSQLSRGSSLPSLNYRGSRQIMQKQKSEYNIISNLLI